jgi:hypothetical protein
VPVSLLDATTLSQADRVDLLVALARRAAWVAALQQEVLATMTADPAAAADEADRSGRERVREDVSCALRLSNVTAQRQLTVAQALVERLAATLALLLRGEIGYLHAMALAEAVDGLDGEAAAEVEQRVASGRAWSRPREANPRQS